MEAVNWYDNQKMLTAPLLGVKGVLVYLLLRGRNAWHTTWIRNYRGPAALYASLDEAKAAAEDQRVQGSVFYIRELPALSLLSEVGPVVLVEFHSDNCFGRWQPRSPESLLQLGTPLGELMHSLGPSGEWRPPVPSEHSFVAGRAKFSTLVHLPARRPFVTRVSAYNGPRFYLRWLEVPNSTSRRGVNAIVKIFKFGNAESERERSEATYWKAAEAHRNSELEGLLDRD